MRIAYLMQEGGPDIRVDPRTGPANHVLYVLNGLRDLGHQVRLLACYEGKIWKSDDLETYRIVTVEQFDRGLFRIVERVIRGIQSRLRLPYINLFESLRFAGACRQELHECDLFYERLGWMGYGGGFAARWLHKPHVLEANNGDFITELERLGTAPKGIERWLAIRVMRNAIHKGKYYVASGQGHARRFTSWWQVKPEIVTVIENGSEVVDMLERNRLKAFTGAQQALDDVTVVFVGAFDPWQGVTILIHAMQTVVTVLPSTRFVLIGSGSEKEQIEQLIHDLDLDNSVELTGQLSITAVAERLAGADIGVAPYCGWMEYSGLKLFDYKSAGLAIIASGEDGNPVTIQHAVNGWIVPPCDEVALADAIIHLAKNAQLRQRMGQAARLDAEQQHSWKHTVAQLEELFLEVLDQDTQ